MYSGPSPVNAVQAAYVQKYFVAEVPAARFELMQGQNRPLFVDKKTGDIYDFTTNERFNLKTKRTEKFQPAYLNPNFFNPIEENRAPQPLALQHANPIPESKPAVHNGRAWQKIKNVSSQAVKKVAGSLCLVFAAALALATACGGYATFALLVQQGNPVGAVVGFLTIYFGVATYKYAKIALSKLHQENPKPLDCIKKA